VVEAVKQSISISGVLRLLGLDPRGSNYPTAHRYFKLYELDTTHLVGRGWSLGKEFPKRGRPLQELLVARDKVLDHSTLKKRLVHESLLENKCYECEMGPEWRGKPLVLRLDHINGTPTDYRIENLRLLCPNCDSQSSTYCGRNIKKEAPKEHKLQQQRRLAKQSKCKKCRCAVTTGAPYCRGCTKPKRKVADRPSLDVLEKQTQELGFVKTGKLYGVSDNAVRKWIKWEKAKLQAV